MSRTLVTTVHDDQYHVKSDGGTHVDYDDDYDDNDDRDFQHTGDAYE